MKIKLYSLYCLALDLYEIAPLLKFQVQTNFSDKGIAVFNATAPDTITSWEISAFSISESLGLGIADVQKVWQYVIGYH